MSYLLDTCVLFEFTRRQPDEKVLRWVDDREESLLFLSVITLGEIQRGIERLPDSHRKTELLTWMENGLISRFGQRVLPIDRQTMLIWGSITAQAEKLGRPMSVMDSLIAATAVQHNLIVATRNGSDFLPGGVRIIDPWQ